MKFSTSTAIAFCALSTVNAFVAQAPKSAAVAPLQAGNLFLENMNGNARAPNGVNGNGSTRTMQRPTQNTGSVQRSQNVGSAVRNDNSPNMARYSAPRSTKEVFDDIEPVKVQGGSLKTCSFAEAVNRVSVFLKTTGRPLNANVDLWQGPDNSPQKMSVYLEDGDLRPFRCTIESPGSSNAIAIRNTGQMEFPLTAGLECDFSDGMSPSEILLANSADYRTVQGGAVYTTPFPPAVQSVQVSMKTDGRPLNARVELLQGPNNNKQVMDIYTEDGSERPFYVILDTPGTGNVVRIVNTATVEFPLTASVEPYIVDDTFVEDLAIDGGMTWS